MTDLTSQQKGRCGELFVQYMLLKNGIESAPLTTDIGIDLVAYPKGKIPQSKLQHPMSIQVKASSPRDEWVAVGVGDDSPADLVAAVDIYRNMMWLFRRNDFVRLSGKGGPGKRVLWWYTPEHDSPKAKRHEYDYERYAMDAGIRRIFR